MTNEIREWSLFDFLDQEWIKLPTAVMRDCGAAAQTMGTLLKITNKETFMSSIKIAKRSRQLLSTTRNHMKQLHEAEYIRNLGRQGPRRTPTIRILQKGNDAANEFGILPWWAFSKIVTLADKKTGVRGGNKMPWSARAVLSIVLTKLAAVRSTILENTGELWGGESLANAMHDIGGLERFHFSHAYLHEKTGLHTEAILKAKRWLSFHKIIKWHSNPTEDGGTGAHLLIPSETFRVKETPCKEGGVYLDYIQRKSWSD